MALKTLILTLSKTLELPHGGHKVNLLWGSENSQAFVDKHSVQD